MPFTIVSEDITKMRVDAVVNAANTALAMGGGVCGAIFRAAGPAQMQAACDKLGPIRTGEAAVTPGFDLPCQYVIHAAGPVYADWTPAEAERLLCSAYRESLRLARRKGCKSVAFPLISGGIYGYPKGDALRVAETAILDFIYRNDMDVYLAIYDKSSFVPEGGLLSRVDDYLKTHLFRRPLFADSAPAEATYSFAQADRPEDCCAPMPAMASRKAASSLSADHRIDDLVSKLDESFSTTLLRLIDDRGWTDVAVYKRANIDRKLFSKIRTGRGYMPSKRTALALAVALELDLKETDDLLERAGYALSHSQKFDVIVEYFIVNQKYDIFEINEVLFQYDQPLLGA